MNAGGCPNGSKKGGAMEDKKKDAGDSGGKEAGEGGRNYSPFIMGLLVLTLLATAFTQVKIGDASRAVYQLSVAAPALAVGTQASAQQAATQSNQLSGGQQAVGGVDLKALEKKVLSKGVPDAYGAKLGISYDNVQQAMDVMKVYDDGKPMADAALNARYVKIAGAISCEYCCGVQTIIFPNGQAACGCAHSYAMRGLAKYLLANNPEMGDDRILEELAKWKSLFFPQQSMEKAVQFSLAGKDINQIDLQSNKYRGFTAPVQAGSASSGGIGSYAKQVGGC